MKDHPHNELIEQNYTHNSQVYYKNGHTVGAAMWATRTITCTLTCMLDQHWFLRQCEKENSCNGT